MTFKEAKELKYGQYVYHAWARRRTGLPVCGRVCSIKLWKRDPNRFRIGLRLGFTDHCYVEMDNAHEWYLTPEEVYKERPFRVEKAHLEIVPEFGFTGLRIKNKVTKEQTIVHNYTIRLYLIVKGANHRACVAFEAVGIPQNEYNGDSIVLYSSITIRRAMSRMKRRAHKIFGSKKVWCDLRDQDNNLIGIRTI